MPSQRDPLVLSHISRRKLFVAFAPLIPLVIYVVLAPTLEGGPTEYLQKGGWRLVWPFALAGSVYWLVSVGFYLGSISFGDRALLYVKGDYLVRLHPLFWSCRISRIEETAYKPGSGLFSTSGSLVLTGPGGKTRRISTSLFVEDPRRVSTSLNVVLETRRSRARGEPQGVTT